MCRIETTFVTSQRESSRSPAAHRRFALVPYAAELGDGFDDVRRRGPVIEHRRSETPSSDRASIQPNPYCGTLRKTALATA